MNCPICNRPLKSKKSIAKGIGPICARKLSEAENKPPEGQTKIDDYLKEGDEH